jgi:hypothetical protein
MRSARAASATGPVGQAVAQPAFHAWQAAGPRAVATGRFRPNTVRQILNRFQLFFIPEIVPNFQNS